jgi:hypothetical protein
MAFMKKMRRKRRSLRDDNEEIHIPYDNPDIGPTARGKQAGQGAGMSRVWVEEGEAIDPAVNIVKGALSTGTACCLLDVRNV